MNKKEKALVLINYYGAKHQLKKLNEEVFELDEAVWKALYKKKRGILGRLDINHIQEEFADVLVLLEQVRHYCNLDLSEVGKIMDKKMDRQIDRILLEKEENRHFIKVLYIKIRSKMETALKQYGCVENILGDKL